MTIDTTMDTAVKRSALLHIVALLCLVHTADADKQDNTSCNSCLLLLE